jgi:hypothetical protein
LIDRAEIWRLASNDSHRLSRSPLDFGRLLASQILSTQRLAARLANGTQPRRLSASEVREARGAAEIAVLVSQYSVMLSGTSSRVSAPGTAHFIWIAYSA